MVRKRSRQIQASLPWILIVLSLVVLLIGSWLQSSNVLSPLFQNFTLTIGSSLLVSSLTSAFLPYVLPSADKDTLIRQLKLYYSPRLIDEVLSQVLGLNLLRDKTDWILELNKVEQPQGHIKEIEVKVHNNYILTSKSSKSEVFSLVYHLPNTLLQGSKILEAKAVSITHKKELINIKELELKNYLSKDSYGVFLRIPITLRPFESIDISLTALERHASKSEIILVSYIPSDYLRVRVEIEESLSKYLELRPEYYHPSKVGDNTPSRVGMTPDRNRLFSEYLIDRPCLPYQGLRIGWKVDSQS